MNFTQLGDFQTKQRGQGMLWVRVSCCDNGHSVECLGYIVAVALARLAVMPVTVVAVMGTEVLIVGTRMGWRRMVAAAFFCRSVGRPGSPAECGTGSPRRARRYL